MNKGNLFFLKKNIKDMKLHTITPETSENVFCTNIQIRKS